MIYTYSKANENPEYLIHSSLINIEDPLFIFCHLNNGYYGCDFKFHKCVNPSNLKLYYVSLANRPIFISIDCPLLKTYEYEVNEKLKKLFSFCQKPCFTDKFMAVE